MLVIQDDVKDSGECVHAAGCVHTHLTAKQPDFLPVRVFSRAAVPFRLLSLFCYLSPPGCMSGFLWRGGVGSACLLCFPWLLRLFMTCEGKLLGGSHDA